MQLKLTRQPINPSTPPKRRPAGSYDGGGAPPIDAPAAEDAANYIAEIVAQLEAMALGAQLDLLAYFLRLAQFEARSAQKSPRPPGTKKPPDPTSGIYTGGAE